MQPIQGFENVQAVHGRRGMLPAGAYVVQVIRASEDTTNYGNACLKVVFEIAEGDYAGYFADVDADESMDWRHTAEIDVQEANGARLKALVEAVQASNPGYVWDWNEQGLVGRTFGLVLQERKVTLLKGKNKGQDRSYLDFWDAVPVDAVRAGQVATPPVNDKRTSKPKAQQPVSVPQGYQQQAPAPQPPMAQAPVAPVAQPQMPAPMPQQAYQQGYQQPMAQQPMPQQLADVYDSDIPY